MEDESGGAIMATDVTAGDLSKDWDCASKTNGQRQGKLWHLRRPQGSCVAEIYPHGCYILDLQRSDKLTHRKSNPGRDVPPGFRK
jgi:hypothetical protein